MYVTENEPNQIVFTSEAYNGNETAMWGDISYMLKTLTLNDYLCVFRQDDEGIYCIDYVYDDESMGTPYPYFMTPDEHDEWECYKRNADKPSGVDAFDGDGYYDYQ